MSWRVAVILDQWRASETQGTPRLCLAPLPVQLAPHPARSASLPFWADANLRAGWRYFRHWKTLIEWRRGTESDNFYGETDTQNKYNRHRKCTTMHPIGHDLLIYLSIHLFIHLFTHFLFTHLFIYLSMTCATKYQYYPFIKKDSLFILLNSYF